MAAQAADFGPLAARTIAGYTPKMSTNVMNIRGLTSKE